ncbi:hypothetical protein GpartN1_g4592.t1 [Galdieria partita]|uniref:S1 motif domain-containing protein n=1 Tax=Galdieria partita TaxID=83374 RepID=A0A9C7PYA6_9RHOD|nr:hypothetical protein GpartN1_g4592.t1 [Galdieria partita]
MTKTSCVGFLSTESSFQYLNKAGLPVKNQISRISRNTVLWRENSLNRTRIIIGGTFFGICLKHDHLSAQKQLHVTRASFNELESDVTGKEEPSDRYSFEDLKIGQTYEGTVEKLMPYGAFVNVGPNLSGLLHISQISENFLTDPAEMLSIGQKVQVRVIKLDPEKRQFALSMKASRKRENSRLSREGNRRREFSRNYSQRDEELRKELREFSKTASPKEFLNGRVVSITNLGAFVDFGGPKDGLLFKSEMNRDLQIGDEVQVRIIRINLTRNYLNLSMKPWNEKYNDSEFIVEEESLSENNTSGGFTS